jgi:hypothetical protein
MAPDQASRNSSFNRSVTSMCPASFVAASNGEVRSQGRGFGMCDQPVCMLFGGAKIADPKKYPGSLRQSEATVRGPGHASSSRWSKSAAVCCRRFSITVDGAREALECGEHTQELIAYCLESLEAHPVVKQIA